MGIRKPKDRIKKHQHREASGFSLLEMMMVVVIVMIASVVTVISLTPALQQQRLTNGYNTTIAAMRQARDNAVSQRTSFSVTFSNSSTPNTIVVAWAPTAGETSLPGGNVPPTVTYPLPAGVAFYVTAPGVAGPDGYGTGTTPIDLGYTANGSTGGQSTVYFCPDGSAQDSEGGGGNCAGSWDGGAVYISWVGSTNVQATMYRAVSLWGGTGRIRGWRLYPSASTYQWVRN